EGEVAAAATRYAELETSLMQVSEGRGALLLQLDQLMHQNGSLSEQLERATGELEEAQALASDLAAQYQALLEESAQLGDLSDAQRQQLEATRVALEEAQKEVARLTGARGIYTVQPFDSLSSIAFFFYRDGNRWPDIAAANSFLIGDNPDLIYPNAVLIVP
ncbi:MAG: LysM peptidoglycan-binding domain-containing protein, partial [Truepera sp.]|nr:LysM peptidoglycan-binding domain-containing protein [Truepera sp.]